MSKKGVLGDANPVSLDHTVFYTLSQHFGTRGRQEHHQIKAEELKFVKNALTGEPEYVEWVEGLTDTPGRIGEKGKTSSTTSLCNWWEQMSSLAPQENCFPNGQRR